MAPSRQKITPPLDEETAQELCRQIQAGSLRAFAETHALTLEHFLIKNARDETALEWAAGHQNIEDVLEITGEKLTLAHLSKTNQGGAEVLFNAAVTNEIGFLLQVLNASGEKLTVPWLLKDYNWHNWRTPLRAAAENNHLDQIFNPSLWAGRVKEMMELWKHVPEKHRGQVDYDAALKQAVLQSVRKVNPLDLKLASRAGRRGVAQTEAASTKERE